MPLASRLAQELEKRRSIGALRALVVKEGLTDLCSNDYLGFAHGGVLGGYLKNSAHHGSTGSRLLSGNTTLAEAAESAVAEALRGESCLIFGGGYDANLGLFSALGARSATVLYDELIHASARDGIRLGLSRALKFRHNDLSDLEAKLSRTAGEKIVAVESLYSMDGDLAPLREISALCEAHGAALIVDEAHATGVFGPNGEGLVVAMGLEGSVFARVHTFGKALGSHGGAVVGSKLLREYLINFARSFIYATAPANTFYEAILASLSALKDSGERRGILWKRIETFCRSVSGSALISRCIPHSSPIQSVIVGENAAARALAAALEREGFDARPILSPTVPAGTERLRISLHTHNTEEELSRLISALEKNLPKAAAEASNG